MIYVRDQFVITAAIAAESEYARVWTPGGRFISDPALQPLPDFHPVIVRYLRAWIGAGGYLKRGIPIQLVNLIDKQGERFTLPTLPMDGIQDNGGTRYAGPGFQCDYGCGWWIRIPALADGNTVYLWLAWEGV